MNVGVLVLYEVPARLGICGHRAHSVQCLQVMHGSRPHIWSFDAAWHVSPCMAHGLISAFRLAFSLANAHILTYKRGCDNLSLCSTASSTRVP